MSYNVQKVKINRMNVFVGSDLKQKMSIICKADLAGASFGKYLVGHDADGGNHVFYLDDVTETVEANFLKPTVPSGWTLHRVAIAEGATGTAIATALAAAITGVAGKFTASAVGKMVTVELAETGYAHPFRDALPALKRTGFGFRLEVIGFTETSIGAIDGDIEVAGLEQSVKEIMIHQEGETAQGEIVTGYSKPTLTFNQFESDKDSIKRALVMAGGQTMLPEVEDADEAVGYGPTAVGAQKPQFKVRLHPVDADAADKSEAWTIWKASFNLEKFTFSRTEFSTIPLVASIYPDNTKPKMLQFFGIGDLSWLES